MNLGAILDTALRTQIPLLVWGPPGVGKSACIRKWAGDRCLPSWTVIASLREPSDFGGLPVVSHPAPSNGNGGGPKADAPAVSFVPPRFAVEASEQGGLIFLDELTTAPPSVQAALLRAVLDKAFGDLELDPTRVAVVAAANPPEEAACGWDLAPPLANRFLHVRYELMAMDWAESFPGYWGAPPKLLFGEHSLPEKAWSGARSLVAGFIRARPGLLLQVPQEESKRGRAWPSPRTWDFFSRLLAEWNRNGTPRDDSLIPLAAGCLGEGIAREFLVWQRKLDLPEPEELLQDPSSYRHPARGDQAYAVLSAVVQTALEDLTERRWCNAWKVLAAAAAQGSPDVAAAPARNLARAFDPTFSVPEQEMKAFLPLLKAAGIVPQGNRCAGRGKKAA